jgi:trichoplein keratin filament-binding protein
MRTQIERELQVRERRDIIAQMKDEERLYAHLTKLQIRDKILEERKKREEMMEKIKIQNDILKKQVEDIRAQKQREVDVLEEENRNFKDVCRKLVLDEREKLERQKQINRKLAEEVRVFNELQQMQKEEKKRVLEAEDKTMLEAQLERERMLAELEDQQKERYKRETREFLKQIKARTDEMKMNQKLIDQLIGEEIELQWKKRQEVWEREEKARVKLLKEVYAHRYDNIEEKKQRRVEERGVKEREKDEMRQLAVKVREEEHQSLMDEFKKMNVYRDTIMKQVQEKFEFDQKEKFKEMEEERKRHLLELEYQQAVEAEMRKGEQLIEEIKKLRQYV